MEAGTILKGPDAMDMVNLIQRIDINIIAMIVLLGVWLAASRRLDKYALANRLFLIMVTLAGAQVLIETITCVINGIPIRWLIPANIAMHLFLFIVGPGIIYLWSLYVQTWFIDDSELIIAKGRRIVWPLIINLLVVITNPWHNQVFQISDANVYHRAILFAVPALIALGYMLYSIVLLAAHRTEMPLRQYYPLVLFGLIPTIGAIAQVVFYGVLMMWAAVALTLVVIYVFLQEQMLQIDPLTGAWTRSNFEHYLRMRLDPSSERPFAVVFIDFDEFKRINDTYGHPEGDQALKNAAEIIKSTIRQHDIIARYGGDEFVLFLDLHSEEEVIGALSRIRAAFTRYNEKTSKPYRLEFSYGFDVFDPASHMTVEAVFNDVDRRMYSMKRQKQDISS